MTDRTYLCAPGRWNLMRCSACRSAYLDPRPSKSTIQLAYANYYESAPPAEGREPSRIRLLRRSLRNGYLNARYGYRTQPASRLGAVIVPFLGRQRERADEGVRHLRADRTGRRLLDVGCGEGAFLAEMAKRGWAVVGIEPSPDGAAAARRRGVQIEEGTLAEVALEPASYEAITLRIALEYVVAPEFAIAKLRDALVPGGTLWIAAPNLDSLGHRRFERDWIFLDVPRVTVLYTPSALTELLRRHGFAVEHVRPSRQARWSFRLSAAIAQGLPPFRRPPPLTVRDNLAAWVADTRALRHAELAEVVVVIARKR
jgi:SAM-dependent methyltransferase